MKFVAPESIRSCTTTRIHATVQKHLQTDSGGEWGEGEEERKMG